MRTRLVAAALVTVLVAGGCGGTDNADDTGAPDTAEASEVDTVVSLNVVGDELEGGARRESAKLGDSVKIVVTGDSTDKVHVHGYDRYVELADGAGELTFDALIPGVFEIELEEAGVLLVQFEVS